MDTALLRPDDALDPHERKFVSSIREHGWYRTTILADDHGPGFSYTTGFWVTLGQPEWIVFDLQPEAAHDVFWGVFRRTKAGQQSPIAPKTDEIFENIPACLQNVDQRYYREYLGWSRWFYGGDDFPCVQLVWPDREGAFPWEPTFDTSMAPLQPDLSRGGWER